jgi:RNA polymerase sigma-70 factor (ECF subfamily)
MTSEPPMTDLDIIKRVIAGEKELYAELVRRHHLKVIALCRRVLSNPSQAEDAAQEVFIKVYGALPRFRGDSAFTTWLYRLATNHCLDIRRQNKRQRAESLDAVINEEGQTLASLLTESTDSILKIEQTDLIERLLSAMPSESRDLLVLREAEGLSYQELADVFEISLEAVKSRLRRARAALQEKLGHFYKTENVPTERE